MLTYICYTAFLIHTNTFIKSFRGFGIILKGGQYHQHILIDFWVNFSFVLTSWLWRFMFCISIFAISLPLSNEGRTVAQDLLWRILTETILKLWTSGFSCCCGWKCDSREAILYSCLVLLFFLELLLCNLREGVTTHNQGVLCVWVCNSATQYLGAR